MTLTELAPTTTMSAVESAQPAAPSSASQQLDDYRRIEAAIRYLDRHAGQQPSLEEIARAVDLSPYHFQRLFSRWAGISPKRFLQFLTVEQAKRSLSGQASVLDASYEAGLSGPARLHDHFVALEAITPGEFKEDIGPRIRWGVQATPFGEVFLAVTDRGVCRLAFLSGTTVEAELEALRDQWRLPRIVESRAETRRFVKRIFEVPWSGSEPLPVLIRGTNFQVNVWKALLRIPSGSVVSYGHLAEVIGKPGGARAVGQAIGANSIAYLIPCHRVIRRVGAWGGYHWGVERKRAMLAWEAARLATQGSERRNRESATRVSYG